MDYLYHPFAGKRQTIFAKNGMVATSQPLAAQVGLEILKKGGNAIDAAIATAAALTVVEPTSNGIGGDAFALVWVKGELYGLNASGPSPEGLTAEAVKALGYDNIPSLGVVPVTVPGVPAAWAALSKRFGKLTLSETLEPAIRYAEEGFPVSPTLGKYWKGACETYKKQTGKEFEEWFKTFGINGRAPEIGEMWSSKNHAETLRKIGQTDARSFYEGELAERIEEFMIEHGGFLRKTDLATFEPEWVKPISTNYRGYDVWEIPPNGQGMIALMALNNFEHLDPPKWKSVDTIHQQIESMKLAFVDGKSFITEQADMPISTEYLLSKEHASKRVIEIGETAIEPKPMELVTGGTVYLATADSEGNMVSFIQSNYKGFGSGIVIPGTGIALQNRGVDFSLDPNHPNYLKPKKRTYHTIIPGFLTKGKEAVGPFGVMGGFMQPQAHFQVISHTIDFMLNPQATLDVPRWQWVGGKKVQVEPEFPNDLVQALQQKGHEIEVLPDTGGFGRGQIIWRNPETGVLAGGTESRTDGMVAAW